MKKREFGVSFAVEASPWHVTSPGWEWQTGIFPGGLPGETPFFIVLIVVGAYRSLPSLLGQNWSFSRRLLSPRLYKKRGRAETRRAGRGFDPLVKPTTHMCVVKLR